MADDPTLDERLAALRQPIAATQQSADLTAMAAVRPALSPLASKVRVAAGFLAGLLIGSTGLAAANALPDPAQHVAHQALDRVGLEVPDPERYHGPECGDVVAKNHGGYVKLDKALATTDCGKKANAGGAADDGNDDDTTSPGQGGGPGAKGPCQGKPPWAGNKTMTPEQKAAAQAERAAQCGTGSEAETEAHEPAGAAEAEAEVTEPTTTTSAPEPTSTTEAPTTTVADTTTTTAA